MGKATNKESTLLIYRAKTTERFFELYFGKENKLSTLINEKSKKVDANDLSYRIINYWEKEGLLNADRPDGKGWRKYSLLDIVWLQFLLELRKFGYPIESLKKVKADLSQKHPLISEMSLVPFEGYLAIAISQKIPCYLNVLSNGVCLCTTQNEKDTLEREAGIFYNNPPLVISINWLLSKVTKKDFKPNLAREIIYTDEFELTSLLRLNDYQSATVYYKDGKLARFEGVELKKFSERIHEMQMEHPYQSIELVQADGKITHIKRTIKKKFN